MTIIKHKLEDYYPMKAVFENILGNRSYMNIKHSSSIKDWKNETIKLLKAIFFSIKTNVEIVDDEWKKQINTEIEHGVSRIKAANELDEMLASLSATLTRITFLQIGFLPHRYHLDHVALIPQNWKLNKVRSVQYVQSAPQKEYDLWLKQKEEEATKKFNEKYPKEKSDLSHPKASVITRKIVRPLLDERNKNT
jgi:hypothetical protein